MPTMPKNESEMYAPTRDWLRRILVPRFRGYRVVAQDTSGVALYRWIEQQKLQEYFPEYLAYDIRVDVTAVAAGKTQAELSFVECKLKPISLRDLSQLLGYCRVAQPVSAWIISPTGISTHLSYLLETYRRTDILEYGPNRLIRVATWNHDRLEIESRTMIPKGGLIG